MLDPLSPDGAPPPDTRHTPPPGTPRYGALTAMAAVMVVGVLYVGRDIFVPFALAVLLGFILDPLVTRLRRWRLPRALAVVLVMTCTVLLLGGASLFVGAQVVQLSKNLPTYQSTIQAKLRSLRQGLVGQPGSALGGRDMLVGASRMLDVVGGELDATRRALDQATHRNTTAPTRVQIEPAPRSAVQAAADLIEPVLAPVGTAGIVLVFVVFILLERTDMRDRLLRLVGGDLHRTTDALGEAADRVSRYLTMQLLVNASYGVPMAAGLWLIGVPGALLWGLLAAMLRFVPYVGPVIAAVFPLLLAFAVDPGWHMLLATLGLVLTLELVSNNLIEPWLYGASTGLSAVSLIVSAVFWTALWGPVGLILATPLTVCLAVLGRHLPQLAWLDVMLGNAPVFDPPTRLYQRLLAGDVEEAIELATEQVQAQSLTQFYSDTAVPALRLAANDHTRLASVEHRHRVATGMAALLQDLHDEHPPQPAAGSALTANASVLCIGARWEMDTLAAEMLAHALGHAGVRASVLPPAAVTAQQIATLDLTGVRAVCLSAFSQTPQAQLRYVARRLLRRQPGLHIVAGLWSAQPALLVPAAAPALGVAAVAQSLAEATLRLVAGLASPHGQTDQPDQPDQHHQQHQHDPLDPLGNTPQPGRPATGLARPMDATPSAEDAVRLQALLDSGALDPALRVPFDRAAQRVADIFNTPAAMVLLVNAQCQGWHGDSALQGATLDPANAAAHHAWMCSHVVAADRTLVIDDIARDPRFASNLQLQAAAVRFYAGAPLRNAQGLVIGALCILDQQARSLRHSEVRLLDAMAQDLMQLVVDAGTARRAGQASTPPPTTSPTPPPIQPQSPANA